MRKVTAKVKTKAPAGKAAAKAKSASAAKAARAKAKPAAKSAEKPKSRLTASKTKPRASTARGTAAAKRPAVAKPARAGKPAAKPAAKAAAKSAAKSSAKSSAKPKLTKAGTSPAKGTKGAKTMAKTATKTTAKPIARTAAKSKTATKVKTQDKPKSRLTAKTTPAAKKAGSRPAAKVMAKAPAKAAPNKSAKSAKPLKPVKSAKAAAAPAAKKPSAKSVAKKAPPKVTKATKPTPKATAKSVAKAAPKVAAKPAAKAAAKPAPRIVPKAAPKVAAGPAPKVRKPRKAVFPPRGLPVPVRESASTKAAAKRPTSKRRAKAAAKAQLLDQDPNVDNGMPLRRPQVETPSVSARVLAEATARISARRARDMLPVHISTRRLVLRAPIRGDVPDLVKHANNPAIARWLPRLPNPYTGADAIAFIEILAQRADQRPFVITLDNALIGVVGFTYRDGQPPEVGYWLGEPFWGHGYTTEAVRGLIDAAHQTGLYGLIAARSLEDNIASIKVLESAGFKRTGQILEDHGSEPRKVLTFELEAPRWT